MRLAGDVIDGRALRPVPLGELVTEAALADAGFADDADHLSLAVQGSLQGALEDLQLLVPPHEPGEAAPA